MNNTIQLILGVYALFNAGYKIVKCYDCPDSFFGFEVSGPVYIGIWLAAAIAIFYSVYKKKKAAGL